MDYVAGRGTTALGIVGTVLGSIGTANALGAGNLLNMGNANAAANNGAHCHPSGENTLVNRYDLEREQRISELESQIALRDSYIYVDGKMGALRDYVDGKFASVNEKLCGVEVYQATNTATIGCLGQQIASLQAVLNSITRCVVPNSSVCPGWGNVTITPAAATTT